MSFVRSFPDRKISFLEGEPLYKLLRDDVKKGEVFPALRKDTLDFYCGGGVLFRFDGKQFQRNPNYGGENINRRKGFVPQEIYGKDFLKSYESFKRENKEHFEKNGGKSVAKPNERQFLAELYKYTYKNSDFPEVCVLDIEVNFNVGGVKKCDMLLYHSHSNELMFVEGKLFSDSRLSCHKNDSEPDVIGQVKEYSGIIQGIREEIEMQYAGYLTVMSRLFFGIAWEKRPPQLISDVKLLVYDTPSDEDIMSGYSYRYRRNLKEKVDAAGISALWIGKDEHEKYTLNKIWQYFSG
jgi:hypothetical protein